MTKPAWRDNILACYPYILQQLKDTAGVRAVFEAQDFAAISNDQRQIPVDGAVYLIFDGMTPRAATDKNRGQSIDIGFSVILAKQHVTPSSAAGSVGHTITAIAKALQGFDPIDANGQALTIEPFVQTTALSVMYRQGFAYFPLRFMTTVAVIKD